MFRLQWFAVPEYDRKEVVFVKLNRDCMRDILLTVESYPLGKRILFREVCEKLSNYSYEDILYACLKLDEAGHLKTNKMSAPISSHTPNISEIYSMTLSGHDFLDSIRAVNGGTT